MKKWTGIASAVAVALCMIPKAQAEIITAGELIVDLCNTNLVMGTNCWHNLATSTNSVGDFFTKGGGNLNIVPSFSDGTVAANAIYINGASDNTVVSALQTPGMIESNGTRSVEAWIYVDQFVSQTTVGWGSTAKGGYCGFRYDNRGDNGMWSGWYVDAGWDLSNGTGPLSEWVHVAYTYDGTTMAGYINGYRVDSKSLSEETYYPLTTTHTKLSVGAGVEGTRDVFMGYIADVRVHSGVLSAADVLNNYQEGMVTVSGVAPYIGDMDDVDTFVGQMVTLEPIVTGDEPMWLQWFKDDVALEGAISNSLVLTNVQTNDSGHYYLTAFNNFCEVEVTNDMELTVNTFPDYGPLAINVNIGRGSSDSYTGTAIAPGDGTTWNLYNTSGTTSPHTMSGIVDSHGEALGTVKVTIESTQNSMNTYTDTSAGNPNPLALMQSYMYKNDIIVTVSGMPAGEYDLYVYAHGNNTGQDSEISMDISNGGAAGATTDNGEYRNIYQTNVVAEGNSYVALQGYITEKGGDLIFTTEKLNGFQIVSAEPAISGLEDVTMFEGQTNVMSASVTGRAPLSYQWYFEGFAEGGATNSTFSITDIGPGDVYNYMLVVTNSAGAATNNFVVTGFDGDLETYEVNLQLDCTTGGHTYSGTAVSSDNGTNWIDFVSPSDDLSTVTLDNVADSDGNETGFDITISKEDLWNIWYNDTTGTPNPVGMMGDYMYCGPYTVSVGSLPPGDYNLYVYAHGDSSNQVSTITLSDVNGGGSVTTTDEGEFRNIYQTGSVSNSYVKLSGTVGASGTLTFVSSMYLNGFQLQRIVPDMGEEHAEDPYAVEEPIVVESPIMFAVIPAGGPIMLSWSTNSGEAFNVLTNANLLNSNGWAAADWTPYMEGDSYKVTNEVESATSLFFKLESK